MFFLVLDRMTFNAIMILTERSTKNIERDGMSPRTKQAYGRIRKKRIDEITAAAYQVFSNKGFSATMIEDIAQAADVSKGLIYHYFDSKDELFTALVQRAMQGALKLIREASARSDSPWDRLYWLITQVVARARQEPEEFLIIMQAYTTVSVPENVRSMALQYTLASSQAIRELIVAGQAAKQIIMGDPDRLAMTLTACLQGLVLSAIVPTDPGPDLLDVDVVLRMLKA
jgi:AcrR family transcriptional regulator